ncbi:MAG: N-acetylmuramoyl-L-alanine amidase [Candidatus Nanopelagicales bacterium]
MPIPVTRLGDRGPVVAEIRDRLTRVTLLPHPDGSAAGPPPDDAVFDDHVDRAVRTFQQLRGITVDGVVGPQTFRRLEEARWRLGDRVLSYTPGHLTAGDDVLELQRRLSGFGFDCGRADGVFGVLTDGALRDFQRNVGAEADGTCGPQTFKALARLTRAITPGGQPEALREQLSLTSVRTGVADKVVVLDPGHGGPEPGHSASGLRECDVAADIAVRVEGRLAAIGTQVLLTRATGPELPGDAVDESVRAAFANDTGADLVLSLHTDAVRSPLPNGAASFYYGEPTGGVFSLTGHHLAELVQEEVCGRTDLQDCRSHPRTWDLLRLTRMPAVRVELGYLSHPGDASRLADASFRDVLAEGLATAISRFFAPD